MNTIDDNMSQSNQMASGSSTSNPSYLNTVHTNEINSQIDIENLETFKGLKKL